jgi:hypothetical protein
MRTKHWTVQTNSTQYPDIKTYTILEPNPDAGKSGVCYSGSHFGVTTLDNEEDARLISAAPDMYQALRAARISMFDDEDYQKFKPVILTIDKALAKAEGI